MKTNNFELELRRYELSDLEDKISYEENCYNGFLGYQGVDAYQQYLQGLYDNYFCELREKIDTLAITNTDVLLRFLQTKLDLFNDIYDKENKHNTRWVDFDFFKDLIKRDESVDKSLVENSQGAKNQYKTLKFFAGMISVQFLFIEKAINELTQIFNTYSPNPKPISITKNDIEKEKWDNTLKDEKDILNTNDLARIFGKDPRTINRWVKEGVLETIDNNKRPHQFKKDDVKKKYLKVRK
ncbi:MAG: hypothetical protein Q7I99_03840 [Acholeplasmataceae bacterium]|nr:hypothetical protein [Acholeplasmataceae bacterium]